MRPTSRDRISLPPRSIPVRQRRAPLLHAVELDPSAAGAPDTPHERTLI
jgi:hypothetical protein